MKNIDELIKYISEHFVFDEKNYPELKGKDKTEILKFAIRHSALHFSKTAGKIATISEDIDHGKEMDIEDLKTNISKSLINTLRLAELAGMSEKDFVQFIEEKYKTK